MLIRTLMLSDGCGSRFAGADPQTATCTGRPRVEYKYVLRIFNLSVSTKLINYLNHSNSLGKY